MSENENHNGDATTSSPGTILKRCREYHGISLEEAAEATKVGENYLRALEADQIGEFASLAYLKGFLRIYASHLGLNPDDMIRLYERLYKPSSKQESNRSESSGDCLSDQRRKFPWRKLAIPATLLILMIISSLVLRHSPAPPPRPAPQPSAATVHAPAVQPARSSARPASPLVTSSLESNVAQSPEREETKPEQASPVKKPPAEPSKGFILRMKVIQNSTLAVTIDGAPAQNYDLASGDIIEWKAEKTIALELSNAGGVDSELNGKPLKPFGPVDVPVYLVLDANGVRQ